MSLALSIAHWARATPRAVAVIHDGEAATYGDLARFIAAARGGFLAQDLRGPGIAVLAVRHLFDGWVAACALRSLGLTTLPIGAAADLDELPPLDLRVVVTSPAEAWPGLAERAPAPVVAFRADAAPAEASADGLGGGHILRTSGTTGRAKLVLLEPAWEAAYLRRREALVGLGQDSIFHVFDFPLWTGAGYKWAASLWTLGGTVVLQNRPYARALSAVDATHAVVVPATLSALLAAPPDAFARSARLQLSIAGGAAGHAEIAAAKARLTPDVYSRLGATETSVFGFTRLETDDDARWHRLVAGQRVDIVDDDDAPLPPGALGRVRVATAGGPSSYLGDPETTAAFFRNGFFYTGDLGELRADGRLALHGRATDVLNVGGFKIAPGPIEAMLRERFGLADVCLLTAPAAGGGEALFVVTEGAAPDMAVLAATARHAIGGVAPVFARSVAALPRNRLGKIVRRDVLAMVREG